MEDNQYIANYTMEIAHKVEETKDDFIFTTISKFMDLEETVSKIPMSKQILCRALICFKEDHPEEYATLLEASYKRMEGMKQNEKS